MLDLLSRACLHPIDYFKILRTHTVRFLEWQDEGQGTYSFLFEPEAPLSWQSGQHGIFTLPTKNITGKSWRAFSVASSVHEKHIRIATTIPPTPSSFKQALKALTPGEAVRIRGPFGEFHPTVKTTTMVGVAGGIGITPFCAIAYDIFHGHLTNISLELIYAGKNNFFAFADAFNTYATHPNITVSFVTTPEAVNGALETAIATHSNHAEYYLSGSPGMIDSLRNNLQKRRIKKIINDPFKGY